MSTTDDLRDRIEEVSNATASGQHLITLTVPPDESIDAVRERVEERHAESEYIDSDETTERVTDALERTRRVLDDYEETPENGLAVYAGVLDAETVEYTFDDLPSAVAESTYERANEFRTDPLDVAAESEASTYGLLVVEHGEAILGTFEDGEVEMAATFESERAADNPTSGALGDREQVHRDFFERVARETAVELLDENPDEERRAEANPGESDIDPVDGLFVGGSSVTATEFLDGDYLDHRLQDRVVTDAFEIGDASEEGLRQLAEKASDHLDAARREDVRDRLDDLFSELDDGDEAVAGRDAVDEALEYEAVETTLAVESLSAEELRTLEQRTVSQGGDFLAVPTDVDGSDRLQDTGDVGAVLRFAIE